jgi:transcriptional regulator with XRE-family HTH domain
VLRLKELRKAHVPPLSQEKLAHLAGVTTVTLRRAERSGKVNIETLHKIAAALGVPVGDLFAVPKANGRKRKAS